MFQTIKSKIALMMLFSLAIMIVIGSLGIIGLYRVDSTAAAISGSNIASIIKMGSARSALQDVRTQYFRALGESDPAALQKDIAAMKQYEAHLDNIWKSYYPADVSTVEEQAVADKINAALPAFYASADAIVAEALAGKKADAIQRILRDRPETAALVAELTRDVDINRQQAIDASDQTHNIYINFRITSILLLGVGLIVSVLSGVWLLRVITRPLNRAVRVAQDVAGGKLENRVIVDQGGEFGHLLAALKTMDEKLSSIVHSIQVSAESVSSASSQIASGNMDLSTRTEEQAASLEQTAASMTELTETVKQNADNARQANALAGGAADLADTGNEAVQAMVGTIGEVSSSSARISEITGVIEGIAFQTNILALNAAVEAARAGEQGRGFAVVASEVRTLAQRSASAAKEIKDLISSSVALVENSARQASQVGATMGEVRQSIRNVSQIVSEISNASDEQSRGIDQIGTAVSQMDQMTQQNAALVEQAAAAAQSLQEQAHDLTGAVSYFKFAGMTAQPIVQAQAVVQARPASTPPRKRIAAPASPPSPKPSRAAVAAIEHKEGDWESF
ncbi:methyl-accepting chemotaxis protein [Bordetella sp. FB-8]|uniref:methyl-accepting chemotaxis protein n=1 Tax=Bordetella sp. FB-8 TaxID=1159870 RepID=UPI00039AFF96|nr:methyl-accepting chemotaxis protein [Bordetella sp. FB-8]